MKPTLLAAVLPSPKNTVVTVGRRSLRGGRLFHSGWESLHARHRFYVTSQIVAQHIRPWPLRPFGVGLGIRQVEVIRDHLTEGGLPTIKPLHAPGLPVQPCPQVWYSPTAARYRDAKYGPLHHAAARESYPFLSARVHPAALSRQPSFGQDGRQSSCVVQMNPRIIAQLCGDQDVIHQVLNEGAEQLSSARDPRLAIDCICLRFNRAFGGASQPCNIPGT